MAQIGHLTRGDDGTLTGTIRTLSLNVKARFVPAETSSNEKAPTPKKDLFFVFSYRFPEQPPGIQKQIVVREPRA